MSFPSQSDHRSTEVKKRCYIPIGQHFWRGKWEGLRPFLREYNQVSQSSSLHQRVNNLCVSLQSDHSSVRQKAATSVLLNIYLGFLKCRLSDRLPERWQSRACFYAGPEGWESEEFSGISSSFADETCVNLCRQHCTKSNKLHSGYFACKRSRKYTKIRLTIVRFLLILTLVPSCTDMCCYVHFNTKSLCTRVCSSLIFVLEWF